MDIQQQKPKRKIGVTISSVPPKIYNGNFVFVIIAIFNEQGKPLVRKNVRLKKNQNVVAVKPTDKEGKVKFTIMEPLSSFGRNATFEVGIKLDYCTQVKQDITVSFPELPSYIASTQGNYCPRCNSYLFYRSFCPTCNYPNREKYKKEVLP